MRIKLFEHDCKYCQYLGSDEKADYYFCPNVPTVKVEKGTVVLVETVFTVVARFSDEGSDYTSGLQVAYTARAVGDFNHPLLIALSLAEAKGYILTINVG